MMEGEGIAELSEDVTEMQRLIEGYLTFARGEGSEPTAFIDFSGLVEDAVGKLRRNGSAIDLHCEEPIRLTLRPHAVGRCLNNLIGNAVRYGHHVAVRVGRRGDGVEVCIDDDGPGIPVDKRQDVFKPFHRLENVA